MSDVHTPAPAAKVAAKAAKSGSSDPARDVKVAEALHELKAALRKADENGGFGRALVRELDRVQMQFEEAGRAVVAGTRDEMRLQAHLAAMEARERMQLMEPFVRNALASMRGAANEVRDVIAPTAKLQLTLARMEMIDVIDERRQRARDELRTLERATERVLDDVAARVHALRS